MNYTSSRVLAVGAGLLALSALTSCSMNDAKNYDEVRNIVKESLKISDDTARQIFAPYTQPDKNVLPKRGELDLAAFDRVLALMGQAGVIPTPVAPAARFVDLQYLKAAGIQ